MGKIKMKQVEKGQRLVANINQTEFIPFAKDGSDSEGSVLQLDANNPPGVGFHIYHMPPGCRTTAHQHNCDEHFFIISGDLTDNDGTVYQPGDLVLMKKGTQHDSYTAKGCTLVVYIDTAEDNL